MCSKIILRSHCEFCAVIVYWIWVIFPIFFYQRQVKSCARVYKDQLSLVTVFLFCGAWCMPVTLLQNLNFYSASQMCTRWQIHILQLFTGLQQVLNSIFSVLTKKNVRMGKLGCKSKTSFAEKVGPRQKLYKWGYVKSQFLIL